MGFFNLLFGKSDNDNKEEVVEIDRRKIPKEKIESNKKISASDNYRKKVYKKFYANYPEKPFVSKDREENTQWIEQASMFQSSLVKKEMMIRFRDGLLPGHIYMLYWINKAKTRKTIPGYFEYEYGINFTKEEIFLKEIGYLNEDGTVSQKGFDAISEHNQVIEKRHPKPKKTGSIEKGSVEIFKCGRIVNNDIPEDLSEVLLSDKALIYKEIDIINKISETAKKLSKIKDNLHIDKYALDFRVKNTFYEFRPETPSGRKTKYPLTLHYACKGHENINSQKDYFGEISYSWNGIICGGRLIFWNNKNGCMVKFGTEKGITHIKSVEITKPDIGKWKAVYKSEK